MHEKIIEMFKNNVPQRKIGRDLDTSPSTIHDIIKRLKESGGISARQGQGSKPKEEEMIRTKEEKGHPDCYQQQVQKRGSLMV